MRVPCDLQALYGKEIRQSLKTGSLSEATKLGRNLVARYDVAFQEDRKPHLMISNKSKIFLANMGSFEMDFHDNYRLKRLTSEPGSQTDGSLALEALQTYLSNTQALAGAATPK